MICYQAVSNAPHHLSPALLEGEREAAGRARVGRPSHLRL